MDLKSLGWKFLTKETFGDGKLTITKQRKKKQNTIFLFINLNYNLSVTIESKSAHLERETDRYNELSDNP